MTGLNSSAGISYNKFLAKMASGYRKPNNFFVIPPAKGAAFLVGLPIEKFHGVGPATAARMHAMGIETGADLAALSLDEMVSKFSRSAQYWLDLSRGVDEREVEPNRERKSIGAEDTFRDDIATIADARTMMSPLVEKVWSVYENRGFRGRTVTLKVKYSDFGQITRAKSQTFALSSRDALAAVVEELLQATFPPPKSVRLLGVTISNFERELAEEPAQMTLPIT